MRARQTLGLPKKCDECGERVRTFVRTGLFGVECRDCYEWGWSSDETPATKEETE